MAIFRCRLVRRVGRCAGGLLPVRSTLAIYRFRRNHVQKVLVANRGEIAVRILRACQERGLQHRRDLLRCRPDGAACALCRRGVSHRAAAGARELSEHPGDHRGGAASGAEAIHPGYGFLAENARLCRRRCWTRVGLGRARPRGHPRDGRQGDGARLDDRGRRAGGAGQRQCGRWPAMLSDAEAAAGRAQIGYPVLVKASAGGGGKGMRAVAQPAGAAACARSGAARSAERLWR